MLVSRLFSLILKHNNDSLVKKVTYHAGEKKRKRKVPPSGLERLWERKLKGKSQE